MDELDGYDFTLGIELGVPKVMLAMDQVRVVLEEEPVTGFVFLGEPVEASGLYTRMRESGVPARVALEAISAALVEGLALDDIDPAVVVGGSAVATPVGSAAPGRLYVPRQPGSDSGPVPGLGGW